MPVRHFLSPSALFMAVKTSRIPEGGWTDEDFRSPAGLALVRDQIAAQRAAKLKGARMLSKPLAALLRGHVEGVIAAFERRYRSVPKAAKAGSDVTAVQHAELWAAAIEEAFARADASVTVTVKPPIQSVADDVLDKTTRLISGGAPTEAARAAMRTEVNQIAQQVTSINDTTRSRIQKLIAKAIDEGRPPFEVMEEMRRKIPEIATNRVPTIVRTEMGNAADRATIRGMKESGVVTHVSVTGCEAIEKGIPTWNGIPTCNIRNVPIASAGELRFHPNHTGAIVSSGFRKRDGGSPALSPKPGDVGIGTWEDRNKPVPALVADTPPKPRPPAEPAPAKPVAPTLDPLVRRPVGHLKTGWRAPVDVPAMIAEAQSLEARNITLRARAPYGYNVALNPSLSHGQDACRTMLQKVEDAFGMSPEQLIEKMTAGFGPGAVLQNSEILLKYAKNPLNHSAVPDLEKVNVQCLVHVPGSGGACLLERSFIRKPDGSLGVHHDYFTLPADLQGGGIAKAVSSNLLSLYDHLGVKEIDMLANIDVGGYAWARYGFVPQTEYYWKGLRTEVLDTAKILESGAWASQLSAADLASVKAVLDAVAQQDDPHAIRAIAGLRFKTTRNGKESTVGKDLLLGKNWMAVLDLTDPASYAVYRKYID